MASANGSVDHGDPPASRVRARTVKEYALEIGADIVGIADAETIEQNPPNPQEPQVPSRIWEKTDSIVVIGVRQPLGTYLSDDHYCVGRATSLVQRRTSRLGRSIAEFIEDELGDQALLMAGEETDPELHGGNYGFLSLRHLASEAGLGTFGLEANLLTPEFGPRCYFGAVLTEADLEPDGRSTHQLCIGENCSRCLHACPTDAVEQFNLNRIRCAPAAMPNGIRSILYGPARALLYLDHVDDRVEMMKTDEVWEKYDSIVRLTGTYAGCPRCVEVCPIGLDYRRFLAQEHKNIPERSPFKDVKVEEMIEARDRGETVDWNSQPINERWIGEDGFKSFNQVLVERDRIKNRWERGLDGHRFSQSSGNR